MEAFLKAYSQTIVLLDNFYRSVHELWRRAQTWDTAVPVWLLFHHLTTVNTLHDFLCQILHQKENLNPKTEQVINLKSHY